MTFDKEKEYERRIRQHMNACIHFTGIQNLKCRAEVFYDSVKDDKGTFAHIPCLRDDKATITCSLALFPTRNEAIKDIEESDKAFENCILARVAIVKRHKGKTGIVDTMPCPVCKTGILHYSISSYNGHIHGHCETKNCVSWME